MLLGLRRRKEHKAFCDCDCLLVDEHLFRLPTKSCLGLRLLVHKSTPRTRLVVLGLEFFGYLGNAIRTIRGVAREREEMCDCWRPLKFDFG